MKKTTMAMLAVLFLGSFFQTAVAAEMSTKSFLQAIYIAYWNRAADPGGLAYWIDRHNSGMKYEDIGTSFSESEEGKAAYAYFKTVYDTNQTVTDQMRQEFIQSIYKNLLDREPDAGGLLYWSNQLKTGVITPGAMIVAIINAAHAIGTYDWENINAKIQVAEYFTESLSLHGVDCNMQAYKDVIAGVKRGSDITLTKLVIDGLFEEKNPPSMVFSENTSTMKFNSCIVFTAGIFGDVDPSTAESVQWNSWGGGIINSPISKDGNGKWQAVISGIPPEDTGNFSLKLKNGSMISFVLQEWNISGTLFVIKEDGSMYYGSPNSPTLFFSKSTITVAFGSNVLSGLSIIGVNPADIVDVQWLSDLVGWENKSNARGVMQQTTNGNYWAILTGLPNGDSGYLAMKMKDGSYIWFVSKAWKYSGLNAGYDEATNRISYGVSSKPTLIFTASNLSVDFGSNVLTGLSIKGVNPNDVIDVEWLSDLVGWQNSSTIKGVIEPDINGNLHATLNGMPNGDKGFLCVKLKDGSYAWFVSSDWQYSGMNAGYDQDTNKISYGVMNKPSLTFKNLSLTVNFGSNVLSGLSIKGVNPADVDWIQWNSDVVGWEGKSVIHSTIQKDANGNWFAVLNGMPNNDSGYLAVRLKNGTFVWFVSGEWKYGTNASADSTTGRIRYIM